MTPPDAPAHDPDRFDVLVVGSGFGGSVAALRLTEKGYRVGVLEAGRRFADHELPTTSWRLRDYVWAPALGLFGVQRIHPLRDVLVMAGAGVGGGSLNYANTLYRPPAAFFDDPHCVHPVRCGPAPPKYGSATVTPGVPKNTPTGAATTVSATPISWATDRITRSAAVTPGKVVTPSMRVAWS